MSGLAPIGRCVQPSSGRQTANARRHCRIEPDADALGLPIDGGVQGIQRKPPPRQIGGIDRGFGHVPDKGVAAEEDGLVTCRDLPGTQRFAGCTRRRDRRDCKHQSGRDAQDGVRYLHMPSPQLSDAERFARFAAKPCPQRTGGSFHDRRATISSGSKVVVAKPAAKVGSTPNSCTARCDQSPGCIQSSR